MNETSINCQLLVPLPAMWDSYINNWNSRNSGDAPGLAYSPVDVVVRPVRKRQTAKAANSMVESPGNRLSWTDVCK
jgi:hypothetical protein